MAETPNSTVNFINGQRHRERRGGKRKAAAAGKSVGVHGADTIQQLLNAGLLNECMSMSRHSFLALVFELLRPPRSHTSRFMGSPTVIAGVGVTHLRYPVRKV